MSSSSSRQFQILSLVFSLRLLRDSAARSREANFWPRAIGGGGLWLGQYSSASIIARTRVVLFESAGRWSRIRLRPQRTIITSSDGRVSVDFQIWRDFRRGVVPGGSAQTGKIPATRVAPPRNRGFPFKPRSARRQKPLNDASYDAGHEGGRGELDLVGGDVLPPQDVGCGDEVLVRQTPA
jgi:hypothetical protein